MTNQSDLDRKNHDAEKITLSRNLSLFTVTMIGVGGMIGAGIFVLTGIAAGVAGPAMVRLLHVVPLNADNGTLMRAEQALRTSQEGIHYDRMEELIVEGTNVVETVLEEAKGFDLVIVGATAEPLFKNLLVGNIPEQIARQAKVTVIIFKRRSSPLHSFLRKTVLEPTTHE